MRQFRPCHRNVHTLIEDEAPGPRRNDVWHPQPPGDRDGHSAHRAPQRSLDRHAGRCLGPPLHGEPRPLLLFAPRVLGSGGVESAAAHSPARGRSGDRAPLQQRAICPFVARLTRRPLSRTECAEHAAPHIGLRGSEAFPGLWEQEEALRTPGTLPENGHLALGARVVALGARALWWVGISGATRATVGPSSQRGGYVESSGGVVPQRRARGWALPTHGGQGKRERRPRRAACALRCVCVCVCVALRVRAPAGEKETKP